MVDIATVSEAYNQLRAKSIALIDCANNLAKAFAIVKHSSLLKHVKETLYLQHSIRQYTIWYEYSFSSIAFFMDSQRDKFC